MTSKAKIAMTNKRKLTIIAVIAIVSVSLASFALLFSYVYSFTVNIFRGTAPAELKRGSQTQVGIIVHYYKMNNPYLKNQITLSVSGSGASWASFPVSIAYTNGTTQTFPQNTISTPSDGAVFLIKIPVDAQTGGYEIIVTGNNSVGQTSSETYIFTVI